MGSLLNGKSIIEKISKIIDKKNNQQLYFVIILLIICFFVRFLNISPWLVEWDSVRFALALKEYSIPLHQPHPQGYFLYILTLWIL
jgi:ABC-type transport system involved in cytochrome bd biosynthesis fused ATPase/permease subunit